MTNLVRADILLTKRGITSSREKAKNAIESRLVVFNGKFVSKPGSLVDENCPVKLIKREEYVSRGGKKLEWGLSQFDVNVDGKTAIDVGASTGGFTQCLLKYGAKKVYAVDVGYGQLDWRLRNDPRVEVLERTNIKYLTSEKLGEEADLAVIDVSFISVVKIINAVTALLSKNYDIVALIKPQFEAGKEKVGKGGIVRQPEIQKEVLESVFQGIREKGVDICGATYSPIKGADGNIEYFFYLRNSGKCENKFEREQIKALVDLAQGAVMKN